MFTPCGPSYVRSGWGRVFKELGHTFMFWQPEKKSAFDIFSEFEPDIFIGTTYDLDRAIYKNIAMRPEMKVILYASAWGDLVDTINSDKFPITKVTDTEKKNIDKLKKETGKPDFVFLHVHDNWLDRTMGGWHSIGVKPLGILNAADTFDYMPGTPKEEFKADLAFVGGYWPYKSENINKFLLPYCVDRNYIIKIFGNQAWPVPQYLGYIDNSDVKDIFASATICPNVSEPHSTEYGYDIVERPFKVLASGAFCISDYVQSAVEDIFGDTLPSAKTPKEFQTLIREWIQPDMLLKRIHLVDKGRKLVLDKHTYFDRVRSMFENLEMPEDAKKVKELKTLLLQY